MNEDQILLFNFMPRTEIKMDQEKVLKRENRHSFEKLLASIKLK